MRKIIALSAGFAMTLSTVGVALATSFPDVPPTHIHYEPIMALVNARVINGNPDGYFYGDREVNRAEMLKMLYLAKGKIPDPSNVRCFTDVIPGSWYEAYVCDAAANRLVNGYPDGTFKPGQSVNRVEALKMITTVFDIEVGEIDDAARDVVKFVDVSTAAWYTKYLYAGFSKGILPIAGQEGSRFYPDRALLRAEAAAYIHNGLNVELLEVRKRVEEQVAQEEEEEVAQSSVSSATSRSSTASSQASAPVIRNLSVTYPFEHSGKFDGKRPSTFTFDITSPVTADFIVELGASGSVSCRLYLLTDDGFTEEYYLGHQEDDSCRIRSSLNTGSYQLQLQPTVADSTFVVESQTVSGDNNDGFRNAIRLYRGSPNTAVLDTYDVTDWYTFVVGAESKMTVTVIDRQEMDCLIYPMSDVDIYGFEGPECNFSYNYPTGTYYVAVSRKSASLTSRKTYTIQLQ